MKKNDYHAMQSLAHSLISNINHLPNKDSPSPEKPALKTPIKASSASQLVTSKNLVLALVLIEKLLKSS